MKILHIITRLIRGGAQQNTVLTCASQVQDGHDVALAYGPIYGPEGSLLDEARASGAQLHEIPQMVRSISPWRDISGYRQLCRLVSEVRPDIVQTHSSKAGILGRAAAWRQQVPVVVHTVHGLPFHEQQAEWINRAYVAAERWGARRCHRLIGVSHAMEHQFARRGIGRVDQFVVVHNGFDLEAYDQMIAAAPAREQVRRRFDLPGSAPVLGIVGRLDALKGQADLLDVLPKLIEAYPDLRVVFIGEGWMGDALRERVRDQGLGHHVVFTGMVGLPDLVALLRAIDLNVLPSYREGLPRTLVESLLCGCPITAYDIDGVGEVCMDRRTGRLVPVADRDALAEAILWMLESPDRRRCLTERGREMVRRTFDLRAVTALTEQLYRTVQAEGQNRAARDAVK